MSLEVQGLQGTTPGSPIEFSPTDYPRGLIDYEPAKRAASERKRRAFTIEFIKRSNLVLDRKGAYITWRAASPVGPWPKPALLV